MHGSTYLPACETDYECILEFAAIEKKKGLWVPKTTWLLYCQESQKTLLLSEPTNQFLCSVSKNVCSELLNIKSLCYNYKISFPSFRNNWTASYCIIVMGKSQLLLNACTKSATNTREIHSRWINLSIHTNPLFSFLCVRQKLPRSQ